MTKNDEMRSDDKDKYEKKRRGDPKTTMGKFKLDDHLAAAERDIAIFDFEIRSPN